MIAQPQGRVAINPQTGERVIVAGPATAAPPAYQRPSLPAVIEGPPREPPPISELDRRNTETSISSRIGDDRRAEQGLENTEQNQAFNRVETVRREFASDPEIRGFSGVRNSFEALERIGQSGTPQSDMALIFSFMRALDPGSVVRETEQQMAQGATSLGGQFENFVNRLMTGEKLNDQQRSEMIAIARQLYNTRAQNYNERADRYRRLLSEQNVPREELMTHIPGAPLRTDPGAVQRYIAEVQGPAAPSPSAQPRGDGSAERAPDIAITGLGGPDGGEARLYEDRWESTGRNDPNRAGLNGRVRQLFLQGAPTESYRAVLTEAGLAAPQVEAIMRDIAASDNWARRNRGRREDVGFDLEREQRFIRGADISQARNPNATGMENVGQRVDSVLRGGADTLTMGLADEAAGLIGGEAETTRQRAIDQWDEDNQTGTRLVGQIAGGALLPFPGRNMSAASALGRYAPQMQAGAAYGGAYGFGSGDGDLGQRTNNALTMAGIGAVAPPIIDSALRGAGGVIARNIPRTNNRNMIPSRAEAVSAADRLGITGDLMPSTVGGTGTQMATGVSGVTLGRIPIDRGITRETNALASAVDDVAARTGRVRDAQGAGLSAQEGVETGIAQREAQQRTLFGRVAIQPNASAVTSNTQQRLADLTADFSSNPELGEMFRNPALANYLNALEQRGLSWRDLNRFREEIGQRIGSPTVVGENTTKEQLRALYGAIREDMRATARASGPQTERTLENAFQFAERLHRDREQVFTRILGRRMAASGEDAYRAITSMARREGGDISSLRRLFAAVPREEANAIRATWLSRLGMSRQQNAQGDAFSPDTFVTEWSKLSPAGQRALMGREQAQAIGDLVTVASRARAGRRFTNWSNSAVGMNATGALALGGTGAMSAGNLAIAAALSYAGGKAMSSPILTRALAAGVRDGTPDGIATRLSRIAATRPELAQDATGLRDMILRAANDNLAPAARQAAASEPGQGQDENNPR